MMCYAWQRSAEHGSEHPLASRYRRGCQNAWHLTLTGIPSRFTSLTGRGLQAAVEGHDDTGWNARIA